MTINSNSLQSKFHIVELLKNLKASAPTAPQPVPPISFPMPAAWPTPVMTLRMKRRWLKTLTAQDLADVPQEVLVDALCEKGAVFTTKEMARMAKCDEETIRRCIKAGHLMKTLGIRHNRVGAKRFFDWLFRRGD